MPPSRATQQLQARQSQRERALDKLRNRKPPEKKLWLILDDDVAEEHEKATSAKRFAEIGNDAVAKRRAAAALKTAEAKLEETSVLFHFRSAGRDAYEALVELHPPTDADQENQAKANEALGLPPTVRAQFSTKTFPAALIAMSLVEPELTTEDITELAKDKLSGGEFALFFQTAMELYSQAKVAELEK